MSLLPVTHADLKRLCAIEADDTSSDAALDDLLAAQQPVLEYALDPAVLRAATAPAADAGLRATLVLGAAEALAGEWLRRQGRAPGAADDFHLGPLSVTASRTDAPALVGERLAAQGLKRLAPFGRAAKSVAGDAVLSVPGGAPDDASRAPLLAQTTLTRPARRPSVFDLPFDAPFDDLPFDAPFDDAPFEAEGS